MSTLPLCSSDQVVRALTRAGFVPRKATGSHQVFSRRVGDRTFHTAVVLGKAQIPRGTLKHIVAGAGLTVDEFVALLR
jgi:predicted RNA binding protein YcfA (HicA-like mRNA interferase family)